MQLEVITPEAKIFAGEARAIRFPGLDGSFQVLDNHAPIISSLIAGEVMVDLKESLTEEEKEDLNTAVAIDESNNSRLNIKINGGVIEMNDNKVIVLAE